MQIKQNNSLATSALHIASAVAVISILGVFFASTFRAGPLDRSRTAARRMALSESALLATTPEGCVPSYTLTLAGRKFVSAVDDIGNHCDDCGTLISLPFPVTLYDQTFTAATAGSNGHLTFGTPYNGSAITCSPFGNSSATYVLAPYWADQLPMHAAPLLARIVGFYYHNWLSSQSCLLYRISHAVPESDDVACELRDRAI